MYILLIIVFLSSSTNVHGSRLKLDIAYCHILSKSLFSNHSTSSIA